MNEGFTSPDHEQELRKQAERRVGRIDPAALGEKSREEVLHLFHELQVHQEELEMQQEQLHATAHALQASEARYRHLYQFAPSGYFTVNPNGIIEEINFAAARLLGVDRRLAVGQLLRTFVSVSSRPAFDDFLASLRYLHEPQRGEATLLSYGGGPRNVLLEGTGLGEEPSAGLHFLISAVDITERKRLEEEYLQVRLLQQKALLQAIMEAQEEERRRISESLHNGVGQILYATRLNLDRINLSSVPLSPETLRQAKQKTEQLLSEAIRETRRVSHELIPLLLEERGLAVAIEDFCRRFSQTGIQLACHCLQDRLDKYLETAVYRISQELVNNIFRHAGATRARIEVFREGDWVVIEAQDNGQGMDADQALAPAGKGKGIGLKTIQDRVNLLEGKLTIEAAPGGGTLITISLPVLQEK
ncbi:MAG: PAS domain S-box protein [Cytophagales bacterium]|nr:PAS domain S-box protein [Cytophagales bacterium]